MSDVTRESTVTALIAGALLPLATPVDNLMTDPDNANVGEVPAIRRSLNAFGQRKPVVVKRTGEDAHGRPVGTIIAGNHTYLAACDLGWSHVAAVFVDDDSTTAKAYALADNRTGELSHWDEDRLTEQLRALQGDGYDMSTLGWTDAELGRLVGDQGDLTGFKEYDETVADSVKRIECPECGHEWVP